MNRETERKEVEPKEEMVTLPKSQLDAILADIAMLKTTADVGRVDAYEAKHKKAQRLVCHLIKVGERLVTSFSMKQDNGKTQTIELVFDDGTKQEMPYVELTKVRKVNAVVMGRKVEDDVTMLKLETEDGVKIEVDERYINAV